MVFLKSSIFIRLTWNLKRIYISVTEFNQPIILEFHMRQKVNMGRIFKIVNFHPIDLKSEEEFHIWSLNSTTNYFWGQICLMDFASIVLCMTSSSSCLFVCLFVCLSVCLFVCLFVCLICAGYLKKIVDGFGWNLVDMLGVLHGRTDSILVKIHIWIWIWEFFNFLCQICFMDFASIVLCTTSFSCLTVYRRQTTILNRSS